MITGTPTESSYITGATLNIVGVKRGTYVIAEYGSLTGAAFAAVNGLPGATSRVIYDYNGGTAIAVYIPELTLFRFR